jgi:hypothetical protein
MCVTNAERVGRVSAALYEFYEEDNVADLLTDIRHYCKVNDINFEEKLRLSRWHFEAEQS